MVNRSVLKMSLAGLFIALTIIFTRFLSIQNIPLLPFVRISLGPALIIFSSIFLGPFYGALVGASSDILGILLVPNSSYGINPLFTLAYALLGVLPFLLFKLIKTIKNEKISMAVFLTILVSLLTFVAIYGFSNETIFNQKFDLVTKIITFIVLILLSLILVLSILFIRKKYPNNDYVYSIAFTSLFSELVVMLILNTIVKSFFFEVDFIVIFFFQTIVFFLDVPLNTLLVSFLLSLTRKINIYGV